MTVENLRLTWFGDDFTGSTDAMEALTLAGIPSALFLDIPEPHELESHSDLEAIGVAGATRSMGNDRMKQTLRRVFTGLKALGAPICHYKVCSTFDSSPEIGSIGLAAEIGQDVFETRFVPVVVGAPVLGRYVAFGNLFARSGRESEIFRLDRHPTMSHHPVTPMDESDLRLHLGRQSSRQIELFDTLDLHALDPDKRLTSLIETKEPDFVLFDTLHDRDLPVIGRLIDQRSSMDSPLFSVGSSGIEYALTAHWRNEGSISAPAELSTPDPVDQIIVVSGSCSPVTEQQIREALASGFAEFPLDPVRLFDNRTRSSEIATAVRAALDPLRSGRSLILHTCLGPGDPRIDRANAYLRGQGWSPLDIRLHSGENLGEALGAALRALLESHPVPRVVVAGGDTSYHVASALGIRSVRMIAQTAPGSPLCLADAPGSPIDCCDITFKGGQVGGTGFFENVRTGSID